MKKMTCLTILTSRLSVGTALPICLSISLDRAYKFSLDTTRDHRLLHQHRCFQPADRTGFSHRAHYVCSVFRNPSKLTVTNWSRRSGRPNRSLIWICRHMAPRRSHMLLAPFSDESETSSWAFLVGNSAISPRESLLVDTYWKTESAGGCSNDEGVLR